MKNPINNNVFDSRDLIEYRDYLASEVVDEYNAYMTEQDEDFEEIDDVGDVDEDDAIEHLSSWEEYVGIRDFCEELENYGDFEYGEAIIHEDYWVEYVEEMLKDIGYIQRDFPSWIEIDWKATADNVGQDYTEATLNGDTYYMRT